MAKFNIGDIVKVKMTPPRTRSKHYSNRWQLHEYEGQIGIIIFANSIDGFKENYNEEVIYNPAGIVHVHMASGEFLRFYGRQLEFNI